VVGLGVNDDNSLFVTIWGGVLGTGLLVTINGRISTPSSRLWRMAAFRIVAPCSHQCRPEQVSTLHPYSFQLCLCTTSRHGGSSCCRTSLLGRLFAPKFEINQSIVTKKRKKLSDKFYFLNWKASKSGEVIMESRTKSTHANTQKHHSSLKIRYVYWRRARSAARRNSISTRRATHSARRSMFCCESSGRMDFVS
jgi:hypothetical protein